MNYVHKWALIINNVQMNYYDIFKTWVVFKKPKIHSVFHHLRILLACEIWSEDLLKIYLNR